MIPSQSHSAGLDPGKIRRALQSVADCTIADWDFLGLLKLIHDRAQDAPARGASISLLKRQLDLALNSYCHRLRIGQNLAPMQIDARAARRLLDSISIGAVLTDNEVRLLVAEPLSDDAADFQWQAFMSTFRIIEHAPLDSGAVPFECESLLPAEQFRVLARTLFNEAVLGRGDRVYEYIYFVKDAALDSEAATTIELAEFIFRHNEPYQWIEPRPNLTPTQRAREEDLVERLCRRMREGDLLADRGFRPSRDDLASKLADASRQGLFSRRACEWGRRRPNE